MKVLSRLTRSAASIALVSFLTLATLAGPLSGAASGTPQDHPISVPPSALAGEPEAVVVSGRVTISRFIFPRDAAGAAAARNFVHSDQSCAWDFCTIQSSANGTRYKVFRFRPAEGLTSTVELYNFGGLWDTHNHSNFNGGQGWSVDFLDDNFRTIGIYGPGRSDNVQWNPIYYLSISNEWR